MKIHELYPFEEERKKRKRIGRGSASGRGCTSGKGNKGQNSRSGGGVQPWFEGGQMPLQRRLPKRGFKNPFRTEYAVINLDKIDKYFSDVTEVGIEDIYQKGLVKKNLPVKILGNGQIDNPLKITAHKFSKSALEKIKQAGGTAISIEG
jgi:large subunit ribosomal protein L15